MLHTTEYKIRQLGEEINIRIVYQHLEKSETSAAEDLIVVATSPVVDFSAEAMEEIELHCWSDIAVKKTKELLAESALGSPLTNPDQEITQCRTH